MRSSSVVFIIEKSNYAFKRTADQALRSKQTIAPLPLNAALGLIVKTLREIVSIGLVVYCVSAGGLGASEGQPEVHVNGLGCRLEVSASRQRTITCPRKFTYSSEEARHPLIDRLVREAGKGAIECGVIGVGDSKVDALMCAEKAENENKAFWVAFQREGFDSEAWTGASLSIDGVRTVWNYDSNPSGSGEVAPSFGKFECRKLKIDPVLIAVVVCG